MGRGQGIDRPCSGAKGGPVGLEARVKSATIHSAVQTPELKMLLKLPQCGFSFVTVFDLFIQELSLFLFLFLNSVIFFKK